jgi:transcriptional regulator with AAA-type ATPase domain
VRDCTTLAVDPGWIQPLVRRSNNGRVAGPVLLGRERELDALWNALSLAEAGEGRLVLVAGETGISKSALARELAASRPSTGVPSARGSAP